MVTHTAGPWRLNAGDETQVMAGGLYVARASCGGTTGTNLHTAEANARLIAAAPELLELAHINTQAWENALELDLLPPQHRDTAEKLLADNRAAIAKATGAEQ